MTEELEVISFAFEGRDMNKELEAELAALREAMNVYLNLEDCVSLEQLEALLQESSDG